MHMRIMASFGEGLTAFCDGGCIGSSRSNIGGSWAWCHVDGKTNTIKASASGILLPTPQWPTITGNYSEFVAAVRALEALPEGWDGLLCSDSNITLGRLFKNYGTVGIPHKLVMRGQAAVERLGTVRPFLLDGHPTKEQLKLGRGKRGHAVSEWNVWCDEECRRIMRDFKENGVLPTSPEVTGTTTTAQEARKPPTRYVTTLEELFED